MLYVDATFSLLNVVEDEHTNLIQLIRELTGEKMRRVDRYTLLALAGAMQCGDMSLVKSDAALILATQTGTLSTTIDMMHKIGIEKLPPKPFQFVNSLGNSACYSLAKMLNIHGASIAVSRENFSFESGLDHASLVMGRDGVEQVVVGGLDEAPLPISDHLRRHLDDVSGYYACYEGSHWLRVNASPVNGCFASIKPLGEFCFNDNPMLALDECLHEFSGLEGFLNRGGRLFSNHILSELEQCTGPETGVLVHGTYSGHCFVQACDFVNMHSELSALVLTVSAGRISLALVESV